MTPTLSAATLADSIDALNAALESLIDDLGKEREALRRRSSADDLECIALRKSTAVESVASLYTRMRETLVKSAGPASGDDPVGRLRGFAAALGGRVEKLVELTRACQLANQENGALIGAGLLNSEGALDTLRKLSASTATGTYSASGRTDSSSNPIQNLAVKA